MDWTIEFDKAIEQYLPDLEVLQDEPMNRHTTFRIGGPARRMAFPASREQLVLLHGTWQRAAAQSRWCIGNGTNLLVAGRGAGPAGHRHLCQPDTGWKLGRAGRPSRRTPALRWPGLADLACSTGLTGLEFAHGIPGTVGGGVMYERRGLRRRDEAGGAGAAAVLLPEEGIRTLSGGGDWTLSYRRSLPDGASGGGGAVRGI